MRCLIRIFLVLSTLILFNACASQRTLRAEINKTPQNALAFVNKNTIFSNSLALPSHYLSKFFAPWQADKILARQENFKGEIKEVVTAYQKNPGWDANQNLHTTKWAKALSANVDLLHFPNLRKCAILVRNSALRALPTNSPSFSSWNIPGQGYPFDNLQMMFLSANTPLYALHTTLDGRWIFVVTPYQCAGWVENLDLAYVDADFIKKWRNTNFLVALEDDKAIFLQGKSYYGATRIGELLPRIGLKSKVALVKVAMRDSFGNGKIMIAKLDKKAIQPWPLPLSEKNIAKLANNFLGKPYGWGDLYGYRDCSQTMLDLFLPFAIWLPRNSGAQADQGKYIDLSDYSNDNKEKVITWRAKPFLTLLWMPGHIMLYVGNRNGEVYALHSPWGLHTINYLGGDSGRVVIGKAVITPLNVGGGFINVPATYIDAIMGMTILQH